MRGHAEDLPVGISTCAAGYGLLHKTRDGSHQYFVRKMCTASEGKRLRSTRSEQLSGHCPDTFRSGLLTMPTGSWSWLFISTVLLTASSHARAAHDITTPSTPTLIGMASESEGLELHDGRRAPTDQPEPTERLNAQHRRRWAGAQGLQDAHRHDFR